MYISLAVCFDSRPAYYIPISLRLSCLKHKQCLHQRVMLLSLLHFELEDLEGR